MLGVLTEELKHMEKAKVQLLSLFMVFFVVMSDMEGQLVQTMTIPNVRPLCISQIAIANNACSRLPINPLPPPVTSAEDDDDDNHEHRSGHGHGHEHGNGHGHEHGHEHGHRNGNGHGHEHGHGHGQRHRHVHEHEESPAELNCCRWLKALDEECVCDLLVHLPLFLARPVHEYTVIVDPTCNVTFSCGGRLRI